MITRAQAEAMVYRSESGSCNLRDALWEFGAGHVNWLLEDWQARIIVKVRRARRDAIKDQGRAHRAYCALMQAGEGMVRRARESELICF